MYFQAEVQNKMFIVDFSGGLVKVFNRHQENTEKPIFGPKWFICSTFRGRISNIFKPENHKYQ